MELVSHHMTLLTFSQLLQFCIIEFRKLVPLIIFVVAITNSTLESSCCDKNLRAEI